MDGAMQLRLEVGGGAGSAGVPVAAADILVVVPTLNEFAHIEACVTSLMNGDARLSDVQFIVADGGSTDGTRKLLDSLAQRHANLAWIDNPGRRQAAAINLAVRRFGEGRRILVRCDAHSRYPPGYVTQVADSLARRQVASLVVPMDAVGESCFQKANAWVVDTPLGSGGSAHRGGRRSGFVDHGHHAGFDLATYRRLGGYDESFTHNEDAEYDQRVAKAGGRIFLDADIRLVYLPRASVPSLARQYHGYGRGRARNFLKHRNRPRLRQMIPVANLFAMAGAVGLVPFTAWALVYPAVYLSALLMGSVWMAAKHRSACGLLAGLAAGTMHFAWATGFVRQLLFR